MDIKKLLKEEYERISKNYAEFVNLIGVAYLQDKILDVTAYSNKAEEALIQREYVIYLFNLIGEQNG